MVYRRRLGRLEIYPRDGARRGPDAARDARGRGAPLRKLLERRRAGREGSRKRTTPASSTGISSLRTCRVEENAIVKILDFGLSKLTELTASDCVSALQTCGRARHRPRTVMGTVGDMSPEQASGHDVDFRSDQFSFCCSILYELATGQRAFQRNTGAETLTAIIREGPVPVGQAEPEGARSRAVDRVSGVSRKSRRALRVYEGHRARPAEPARPPVGNVGVGNDCGRHSGRRRVPAWLATAVAVSSGSSSVSRCELLAAPARRRTRRRSV